MTGTVPEPKEDLQEEILIFFKLRDLPRVSSSSEERGEEHT
jgi:hypothetical protein